MMQFEENVRLHPDKPILHDQEMTLTFKELDELSGRVYAYLKEKGIGREDFVMALLPRSVKCYIAMMGIWKAGAAMVLLEDNTPTERSRHIYNDCNCCTSLNAENWDTVMQTASISGHTATQPHDAAFAIYTSGSTGMPKGILHEYGKLELIVESLVVDGENILNENDRMGLPLPMNAGATVVLMVDALAQKAYTDVFPMSFFMNLDQLTARINEQRLTITGIVPSMIMQSKVLSPCLKKLVTGTEMAHRVYLKEYPIINTYGQSESLITPLTCIIDRLYENTPAGRPTHDYGLQLLDDDGQPAGKGKAGEICYRVTFTRGYINDPELTAQAFHDGLYHTGDIARINEDGNYVILGRKTDMIKINGNRIEPAEIETAVKKVLGLEWALAKGFVTQERSFICVYYTDDITIDLASTRERLLEILPQYMIPSYFIHVDNVPHLPNGKIDRKAFRAPDTADYMAPYSAPTNDLEARLCQAMQEVLDIERIGIDDDFFLLGGDSLRTIRLVGICNIEGLNVSDIYSARTPAKIAERWIERSME